MDPKNGNIVVALVQNWEDILHCALEITVRLISWATETRLANFCANAFHVREQEHYLILIDIALICQISILSL